MADGASFERQAAAMLERAGLRIVERNFRCKVGEIDLICRDGARLVFVEVRCRRNGRFASAAASVTAVKQRKLIRAAQCYLQRKGWSNTAPCRFDVVAFGPLRGRPNPGMQWLKNAFTM